MDEPAAEVEEEETISMGRLYYQFLCDELSFLRFELADQRIKAWEEKFLAYQCLARQEELMQSILTQLPPTLRVSSSTLQ
jgi:hypothetical protein